MRLNAPMRNQIIGKAIAAKFDPLLIKHKADGLALGHAFYMHLFGKQRDAIAALPKAFIYQPSAADIKAGFLACAFQLSNGYHVTLDVPVTDLLPSRLGRHDAVLGLIKDTALCDRYLKWQKAGEDWREGRTKAEATLKALLASVATYKSLEREWPEGKKFYSSLPGDFPGNTGLPMVQIKELNVMLGLHA